MTTWNQVIEMQKRDDEGKWDAGQVNAEDITALADGALAFPAATRGGLDRVRLSDLALGQMCGRLGIPTNYVKRLPGELAARCFNHDLARMGGQDRPSRFMLRMKGDLCRAFLSDQYSPVNHAELLEVVERVGRGFTHAVRQYHLDERGFWLKLLVEDLEVPDPSKQGMPLKVGIMVGNSEVGTRSLSVEPFVYRQVCTNDLVVQQESSVSVRHVHLKPAELRYRVTEAVTAAVKGGDKLLGAFTSAWEIPVEDPGEVIRQLAAKRGLSAKLHDEVQLAHAAEGKGENAFAVINAFTQAARTQEGDDRVELERFAGGLLTTAKKWAR